MRKNIAKTEKKEEHICLCCLESSEYVRCWQLPMVSQTVKDYMNLVGIIVEKDITWGL